MKKVKLIYNWKHNNTVYKAWDKIYISLEGILKDMNLEDEKVADLYIALLKGEGKCTFEGVNIEKIIDTTKTSTSSDTTVNLFNSFQDAVKFMTSFKKQYGDNFLYTNFTDIKYDKAYRLENKNKDAVESLVLQDVTVACLKK